MHVRVQSWLLFPIQIYINGHEWLAHKMDRHGSGVFTEEDSLGAYIDGFFISDKLWNEGPTSVLSGIAIILWGSLAGEWLRSNRSGDRKAAGLAQAGIATVILGGIAKI